MTEKGIGTATWTYRARETVGVFADPDALEAAVDALERAGFDRAAISVLASEETVRERVGHLYRSAAEAADDSRAPQAAFVSRHSRVEGKAAAVGIPFQIGGFAGAYAVVAGGGTLAAAIAATILGGAVAGGLGALLAHAVARHHAERVREQLARGGLVLWVGTPDAEAEKRALEVLQKCGASAVHVHTIEREWGVKDRPLQDAQLDPLLLERDPKPG
jgi:VIT1/CCC1 family predicted Fe2+/Mn2+ transporter